MVTKVGAVTKQTRDSALLLCCCSPHVTAVMLHGIGSSEEAQRYLAEYQRLTVCGQAAADLELAEKAAQLQQLLGTSDS